MTECVSWPQAPWTLALLTEFRGAKRGAYGICLKLIYRARFPDLRRSQRSAGGVLGVASLAACTALSHVLSEGTAAEPWRPWVTTAVCMPSSLAA